MVADRIDLKTAQARLGHSDPRLTLAVYAQGQGGALLIIGADPDSALNFAEAVSDWADQYVTWADAHQQQGLGT